MTTGWAAWVAWAAVRLICCCLIAWMMASGGRAE